MHSDASFIVACIARDTVMCQPYLFLPLQRDIPSSPDSVKLLMTTESQKSVYEHRLKKKVKLLICCVAFLVTIIVILAVLFGVLFSKQAKSTMQPTQSSWASVYPCITKECVLLQWIITLDPKPLLHWIPVRVLFVSSCLFTAHLFLGLILLQQILVEKRLVRY